MVHLYLILNFSEELAVAKMTHNTYIHQCNDYRQQLQDNKQELQVLEVRFENTKAAETMQATKVCYYHKLTLQNSRLM